MAEVPDTQELLRHLRRAYELAETTNPIVAAYVATALDLARNPAATGGSVQRPLRAVDPVDQS